MTQTVEVKAKRLQELKKNFKGWHVNEENDIAMLNLEKELYDIGYSKCTPDNFYSE